MKKLLGAVAIGVLGAAYSLLYNYLDDAHQGLFIFASLMTAVTAARVKREAR